MSKYTHLRLSWYLPLPEVITHKEWLRKEALWLNQFEGKLEELKRKSLVIPNIGKITVETDFNYPLIKKYQQLNLSVDFEFSPIFYAATKQKKIKCNINQKTAEDAELEKTLRSLSFNIKCFPAGFVVLNAYLNFNDWLAQPINHKFLNKLICGKKATPINNYIHYLKSKLLLTIFKADKLSEIKRTLTGPKIRIQLIAEDDATKEQFIQKTRRLFSWNENEKVSPVKNKAGDYFIYHKKGVAILASKTIDARKRQYFRHNIDLIADITFGIESLLPMLPKFITQTDQKEDFAVDKLIFTFAYSLNPEVLKARTEIDSMLPTAGTRTWFSQLAKNVKLYEKYSNYQKLINERIDELRIDRWYQILAAFLLENIPGFTSTYMQKISAQRHTVREIINPKVELDEQDSAIIDWFIEKFSKELKERYTPPVNDLIDEEEIGYATLFQIEKHFKIQGREHLNFKTKIDVLNAIGLLESKPYKGPGSKKGSKKYRANPKHQYVITKMKIKLANSIISEIKLTS